MVFGLEQDWEFWLHPWRCHILSIPKTGRGISVETCELDNLFPTDDLGTGPCTPSIIYKPQTTHYSCILSKYIDYFYETYIPKVGVAMPVYWMIWYCYCFRSGFKCAFSCIVQYSLHHNMDIGTMWHCTLVSSTPSQFIGLVFGCVLFQCRMSLGAPVTISLIDFYFIMIFIMIVVSIIGICMAINYFWTTL